MTINTNIEILNPLIDRDLLMLELNPKNSEPKRPMVTIIGSNSAGSSLAAYLANKERDTTIIV